MHTTQTFTASAAPTVSPLVAGGSYAMVNPAMGTSATALLLSAPSGGPVSWLFSATGSQAPAWNQGGDGILNGGGMVLVTDPRHLAAPYIVTCGVLSATPGNVSIATLLTA